jgi:hypothetical protein
MLISIVGGLFCARAWSVAAVAVIAGLLFPTLLTLLVSPEWKRFGFERYFEMQAGNFIALAGYFMVICAIFAFGATATAIEKAACLRMVMPKDRVPLRFAKRQRFRFPHSQAK